MKKTILILTILLLGLTLGASTSTAQTQTLVGFNYERINGETKQSYVYGTSFEIPGSGLISVSYVDLGGDAVNSASTSVLVVVKTLFNEKLRLGVLGGPNLDFLGADGEKTDSYVLGNTGGWLSFKVSEIFKIWGQGTRTFALEEDIVVPTGFRAAVGLAVKF